MIVSKKLSWIRLVLTIRGSVLPKIWKRVAATTGLATWVTVMWTYAYPNPEPVLTLIPFTLIGLALSIFLGFRNSTSYERFWEGRRLWGGFVNTSRSLARQILTLIQPTMPEERAEVEALQRRLVHGAIAYIHLVRMQLRGGIVMEELADLLPAEAIRRIEGSPNGAVQLLLWLGEEVQGAARRGWVDRLHVSVLEASLTTLTDLQGACERIKTTPIPFSYTVLIHRIVALYCVGLPFGIIDQVRYYSPLVVAMVSYAFFGLDAIGDEIEDPFGVDVNDLPLSAISRTIEINLREMLGEQDLPEPLLPIQGVLR